MRRLNDTDNCGRTTPHWTGGSAAQEYSEDLPEKNNPYHSCVSESLPRDAAHNQKVLDHWLLRLLSDIPFITAARQ